MGIAYRFDCHLGLTIIVGDGVVTAEEWRVHVNRIISDPEWPPGRLVLGDLSTADTSAITADDIRGMATAFRSGDSKLSDRKAAIVAGDTVHGNAVMFQLTMGPTGLYIVIFSNIDDACVWLDINTDDVAPTIKELHREIRSS